MKARVEALASEACIALVFEAHVLFSADSRSKKPMNKNGEHDS